MLGRILKLPLIVILMGISALAMYIPAIHAAMLDEFVVMRVFFQSGNLMLILTAMIGIATSSRVVRHQGRSYLLALVTAFLVLPLMLALPFRVSVPDTSYLNAYLEMVSDFTTTGLTLFDDPSRLADPLHLWRALVGWMGGLLMLVAAIAILSPMNLGGYEVLVSGGETRGVTAQNRALWSIDGSVRLQRYTVQILPIYGGLTVILWIVLLMLGDVPLVAASHAMSVLATSGISPVGGLSNGGAGFYGEIAIFFMLFFAISRQSISINWHEIRLTRLPKDPEFRLAMFLVILVASFLFLRHWFGAIEVNEFANATLALKALWGGLFTILSFLTTTGFESTEWADARVWSGLATPGLILMGVALIGGGVATTAGGIKLLRVFALYKHGARELERLVHPSSVGGAGTAARRLRRQGANVAWVFFMLFGLSLAAIVLGLTLDGNEFEASLTMAVAALSTTGPVLSVAVDTPISVAAIDDISKYILALAMVLGRLETLAIIALINPEFWRN